MIKSCMVCSNLCFAVKLRADSKRSCTAVAARDILDAAPEGGFGEEMFLTPKMLVIVQIINKCREQQEKLVIFSERLDNFATLEELMGVRPSLQCPRCCTPLGGSHLLCLARSMHISALAEKKSAARLHSPCMKRPHSACFTSPTKCLQRVSLLPMLW